MLLNSGTPSLIGLTQLRMLDRSTAARGLFTAAEYTDFINMAYLEMVRRIQTADPYWFVKPATFATTTSDLYALPSDLEAVLSLEIDYDGNAATGSSWSPKTLTQVNWNMVQDAYDESLEQTYLFTIFQNHCRIYPKVDSSKTGSAAGQFVYQYTPALLSGDTDEPDLPDSCHEVITLGAELRAKEALEQDISQVEIKWQQALGDVVQKIQMRSILSGPMQFPTVATQIRNKYTRGSRQGWIQASI